PQPRTPITRQPSVRPSVLALMVCATAALMALTVYRVFGTLDPETLIDGYAQYYALSRRGGAWIILSGYAILYAFLIDMFFGKVNRWNSLALLTSVLLNFVSGGRTLLICVLLAYLVLLYVQRPRARDFMVGAVVSISIALASFLLVTEVRTPETPSASAPIASDPAPAPRAAQPPAPKQTTPVRPTDSHSQLNYNAAFIFNDVTKKLLSGELSPAPHVLVDTFNLLPRSIFPDKPLSTSDTRAVYPDVAARNSTITFPLAANLAMHFGVWSAYVAPIVAALFHLAFVWGLSRRSSLVALVAFFWGVMFMIAARGGVLNYRLVMHTVIITVLFLGYQVALRGWFGQWIWRSQKQQVVNA
ncbi:MAG: hypothetical protein Q8O63_01295, partial [Hoeflea sp.]|nr:hypothetical protein [Hoeflea sp.]